MFMQTGLTAKWERDSNFVFKLEAALKHQINGRDAKVKLNLGHLVMPFVGLLLGHVLSGFVFCSEKFCRRQMK